jgi:hypothetical protein
MTDPWSPAQLRGGAVGQRLDGAVGAGVH